MAREAAEWQLEEARFGQERQKREKEDRQWQQEQERSKAFTGRSCFECV